MDLIPSSAIDSFMEEMTLPLRWSSSAIYY